MNTIFKISLLVFALLLLMLAIPYNYFPSDGLNYLPSYSMNNWQRPHNSLLADPLYQFEPWRHFAKEEIRKGELPLWNRSNAGGTPFIGNPQASVFHPFQILYYLVPLSISLKIIPLLKLIILTVSSYFYLRAIGCEKRLSIIGAVSLSSSAFFLTWLLWPHTTVYMLFPLLLFFIEYFRQKKLTKFTFFSLVSVVYFFMVLGGHPGTFVHASIVLAFYALLRLKNLRDRLFFFSALVVGLFLGAFQIVPFLEYLSLSNAFGRFNAVESVYLPLLGLTSNIVPFFLGAPHQQFYKQLSSQNNFQELSAGYMGIIVVTLFLVGLFKMRKVSLVKTWSIITVILFLAAYNVWPFLYLFKLPLVSSIANTRIIAFGAFGMGVVAFLFLNSLLENKKKISRRYFNNLLMFLCVLGFLYFAFEDIVSVLLMRKLPEKLALFYPLLSSHILLIFVSLSLFVLALFYVLNVDSSKRKKIVFLLAVPIFFQSIFLFWNYGNFTSQESYYPKTELIRELQKLPKASILEVGNPNLPPNLNMMYGLKSAQGDDAIGVRAYLQEFDRLFPVKNHWGKVEEVNTHSLETLGVKYVISDYDINLTQQHINTRRQNILPISEGTRYTVPFIARGNKLKQVRILTANFNRKNTCSVEIEVFKLSDKKKVGQSRMNCVDARDSMFYSVQLGSGISLTLNEHYIIDISSNGTSKNSIGLWGVDSAPFLSLLYEVEGINNYKQIWKKKSVYLFEVPKSSYVNYKGTYDLIHESDTKTILTTNSTQKNSFQIARVLYPGWQVSIDGTKVSSYAKNSYITFLVPEGRHAIVISYKPVSFYIGLTISAISFLGLVFFMLRRWGTYLKKFILSFLFGDRKVSWANDFLVLLGGGVLGIFIFLMVIYMLGLSFSPPYSTAINWYVVNKYPRQQEFFYFLLGTAIIIVVSFTSWIVWIRSSKKSKK